MEAKLFVDGGARGNPGPAGCGFVLKSTDNKIITEGCHFIDNATNNFAEYTALLKGLELAEQMGVTELNIYSDSELMVKQIIGEYRVKSPNLIDLFESVERKLLKFSRWQIKHIRREYNKDADRMANVAMDQGLAGEFEFDDECEDDTQSKTESTDRIMVEVSTGPKPGSCACDLKAGQCFVFTDLCPPGLCIQAIEALIPAVKSMQAGRSSARVVKCSKNDCHAVFKLTKA